jgi:Starch-binding associating with outer membrane
MKPIKYIFYSLLGAFLITSCNKQIAEKQIDPNVPSSVPPQLILGTVLTDMSGTGSQGSLGGINSWGNVGDWNQYHCQNYDYYGNNIYSWTANSASFDPYLVMKNAVQMENEVLTRGGTAVNPFEAIARFVKAYYYYHMTSMFGDIPQAQALSTAVLNPAYTSQEQVFNYVLNQLDTANTDFATLVANNDQTLSASQDIYYAGNLAQWQKLVNSFKLRVLVALSHQASDATLNVPAQFANIFNNPGKYPIFTSQSDDMQLVYNPGGGATYTTYPFNPSNFGSIAQRFNMAATYVSAVATNNDPRVFITCDPAWALVGTNVDSPAQYQYFVGAATGLDEGTMYNNAGHGDYSFIGRYRYYSNFTGEPDVLVGYKEMLFNIAEAITRGWVSGSAETYYKAGINESMKFYGIDTTKTSFTAHFLPPGANSVTQVAPYNFNFTFSTFYAQPSIKLSSTTTTAINQIVLQKYIAMFENSGYEAYFNWRRVGVPAFQGGSGVGNNGVIPLRWAYPASEQTQNAANWSAAIANQKFTADDLNQTMWLVQ